MGFLWWNFWCLFRKFYPFLSLILSMTSSLLILYPICLFYRFVYIFGLLGVLNPIIHFLDGNTFIVFASFDFEKLTCSFILNNHYNNCVSIQVKRDFNLGELLLRRMWLRQSLRFLTWDFLELSYSFLLFIENDRHNKGSLGDGLICLDGHVELVLVEKIAQKFQNLDNYWGSCR